MPATWQKRSSGPQLSPFRRLRDRTAAQQTKPNQQAACRLILLRLKISLPFLRTTCSSRKLEAIGRYMHRHLEWAAIRGSVRGASHFRGGLANQDAVDVSVAAGGALPAILAVSDGHGSNKCFRSHVGSQFAVEIA